MIPRLRRVGQGGLRKSVRVCSGARTRAAPPPGPNTRREKVIRQPVNQTRGDRWRRRLQPLVNHVRAGVRLEELLTSSFPECTPAVFQPRLSSLILLTSAETRAQFSN